MAESEKTFSLWCHDAKHGKLSGEDLVISPEVFPNVKVGDIVSIWDPDRLEKQLYLQVQKLETNEAKGTPSTTFSAANKLQISLSKTIAQQFGFASRQSVGVAVVESEACAVDFVELSFKDQCLGRSDLWRLQQTLLHTCLYVQKALTFSCMRVTVSDLLKDGKSVLSGYVSKDTKFVLRSRSAKFHFLVQMSREMWDFSEDGEVELHFELVSKFLYKLFGKWKEVGANHSVSLTLFSRAYYTTIGGGFLVDSNSSLPEGLETDYDGRKYKDFYKTVLSEEKRPSGDWDSVIPLLKREFTQFPISMGWNPLSSANEGAVQNSVTVMNSTAQRGNLLEAINLALIDFDKPYIDRDLRTTGQGIVIITGSTGVFEVDATLTQVTKQKMVDHGVGCDLVCLSKRPLHMVPLFKYKPTVAKRSDDATGDSSPVVDSVPSLPTAADSLPKGWTKGQTSSLPIDTRTGQSSPSSSVTSPTKTSNSATAIYKPKSQYNVPHWLYISFFNPNADAASIGGTKGAFKPRCNMLHLQFCPNPADNCARHGVIVPFGKIKPSYKEDYLSSSHDAHAPSLRHFANYDESVFSLDESNKVDAAGSGSQFPFLSGGRDIDNKSPTIGARIRPMHDIDYKIQSEAPPDLLGRQVLRSPESNNYPTKPHKLRPKQPHLNPFQSLWSQGPGGWQCSTSPDNYSSNRRRWSHLFHESIYSTVEHKEYAYAPNWKSLCEPASLPITTDYCPTDTEFRQNFLESNHTLNADDSGPYKDKTKALLREIVAQRLEQGYQIIVSPPPLHDPSRGITTPTKLPSSSSSQQATAPSPVPRDHLAASSATSALTTEASGGYRLSLGHDYHEFTLEGQNIRVRRYYKKNDRRSKGTQMTYNYELSSPLLCETKFYPANVTITYKEDNYSWNYLDQLICGYVDTLFDSLKYACLKFVIAPVQQEDKEQAQVTAFTAFKSFLETRNQAARSDASNATSTNKDDSRMLVHTISKFALWSQTEEGATGKVPDNSKKINPNDIERLVLALRDEAGLAPLTRDRRWRFRTYTNCFVGSEAVDWLMKNVDVTSRREAEVLGQQLLLSGYISHVAGKKHFKDGKFFYRLTKRTVSSRQIFSSQQQIAEREQSCSEEGLTGTGSSDGNKSQQQQQTTPPLIPRITPARTIKQQHQSSAELHRSSTAQSPSPSAGTSPTNSSGLVSAAVEVTLTSFNEEEEETSKGMATCQTKTMKIEMNPRKTDRYEWVYMNYDSVYNPYEWYHIEFQWLVCTPAVLEDFLYMIERKAKNLGLRWIPIPIHLMDRTKRYNPFYMPVEVSLVLEGCKVISPQTDEPTSGASARPSANNSENCIQIESSTMLALQQEILSLNNFILNKTTGDQHYIHVSGLVFAQIVPEGFLCMYNHLPAVHHRLRESQIVIENLRTFCSDPKRVRMFLGHILDPRSLQSLDETAEEALLENYQFPDLPASVSSSSFSTSYSSAPTSSSFDIFGEQTPPHWAAAKVSATMKHSSHERIASPRRNAPLQHPPSQSSKTISTPTLPQTSSVGPAKGTNIATSTPVATSSSPSSSPSSHYFSSSNSSGHRAAAYYAAVQGGSPSWDVFNSSF
ncbi:DEP domain-containing protein [Balamuthia mandrillaris]